MKQIVDNEQFIDASFEADPIDQLDKKQYINQIKRKTQKSSQNGYYDYENLDVNGGKRMMNLQNRRKPFGY